MKISKKLQDTLKKEKAGMETSRTSTFIPEQATKILEKTRDNTQLKTTEEALAVIAVLFNQGGSVRKCDGNLSVKIFDKDIKLAVIRKSLRECSAKQGERKLARTYGTQIQEISLLLEVEGNLAAKIRRNNPDMEPMTIEQTSWLSEFQLENPDCPKELRQLIQEALSKTQSNQNKTGNNKKK